MEEVKSDFFYDTYALYEVLNNSKTYSPYFQNVFLITTKLNLMELHYLVLRTEGKEKADKAFAFFSEFCVDIDDKIIKSANEFRLKNYRRDLSYIDCIGYITARRVGVKFLTGDNQFKDFEGVEWVK